MGGRKSRNKGANFERAIAKRLRQWLGDDWEVKRNPTDRQKGKTGAGEFEIVGPFDFPFAIECKAHESFGYGQLFKDPITGPFISFWDQAKMQAEAAEKAPLLLLKKNSGPVLAAMGSKQFSELLGASDCSCVMKIKILDCYVVSIDSLLSVNSEMLYEVSKTG